MKKSIIALAALVVFGGGVFYYFTSRDVAINEDQMVLEKTLDTSRKYLALRYMTDNVLLNAESYDNFENWNKEMERIIDGWARLEKDAIYLEKIAGEMANEKTSFTVINRVMAYDQQEISNVFDKAPAGKKIATLAQYLGVDAKKAFQVLKQDQAQVEANAWNEAGDTFQKLESSAVVIKDGCKVAGFVGTIALTGGTSALAAGSTLTKAAVVISGADLALEVTDDGAKIALGNKNKISAIVGDVRTVTEPAAAILMVSTLPSNVVSGIDKLNAVVFGADQLNSAIQNGTVIGIKLPVYTKETPQEPLTVAVLEKEEVEEWLSEYGTSDAAESVTDVENVLGIDQIEKQEVAQEQSEIIDQTEDAIAGTWEGTMSFTPSHSADEQQNNYSITLNSDGTISGSASEAFSSWEKEGSSVRLIIDPTIGEGYDEYALSGDTLTFVKRAGINSEGEWQEDYAGSDFFGGKFMQISLKKIRSDE